MQMEKEKKKEKWDKDEEKMLSVLIVVSLSCSWLLFLLLSSSCQRLRVVSLSSCLSLSFWSSSLPLSSLCLLRLVKSSYRVIIVAFRHCVVLELVVGLFVWFLSSRLLFLLSLSCRPRNELFRAEVEGYQRKAE